ncbi:hypothetical protein MtrunA17_Chr3g0110411 [Medicago truncatula]|uniref:Uncharacterized protein n=1 Tax=Medicago truncatula TaxID=3880 RepID=A0A396IYT0_MEDTR|nr:hypothetical protein MtrunA17_Chr3g0110411 [Medicago truncatula]
MLNLFQQSQSSWAFHPKAHCCIVSEQQMHHFFYCRQLQLNPLGVHFCHNEPHSASTPQAQRKVPECQIKFQLSRERPERFARNSD